MAKSYPSMIALLGLLAVAGYQNRDKIAESAEPILVACLGDKKSDFSGVLDSIRGALNSSGAGWLSSGLAELVERFKQHGRQDVAQSWVRHGPNQDITPEELEEAIGPDVLATLSQQTKLPPDEILARLSRQLPDAVDKYTPEGRLPDAA